MLDKKGLGLGRSLALFLAVLSPAAFAADLPTTKGAPAFLPPPALGAWTGFYGGAVGGWGTGTAGHTDSTGFGSGTYSLSGGIIGGTLGVNWQTGRFVLGLEGDGSATSLRGQTPVYYGNCGGAPSQCASHLDALGTVRGRVGYAIDRLLPYLTGGAAIGALHGHEGTTLAAGSLGDGSSTVLGWSLGAGVEAMITPQWSVKVDYLHADLGKHAIYSDVIPSLGGAVVAQNLRWSADIVRAGINYHFNLFEPAPVAAKY